MAGHHVLLIGIDAYDGGGSLSGCVNDIDAVKTFLVDRVGVPADRIVRLASPSPDPELVPTLANIKHHLDLLAKVDPSDRVLVYYAGHGTQCIVADGQQRRFSREALLPKDKLTGAERRFLFDYELKAAIANIAARTTVVLDCCSSAGATRGAVDPPTTLGDRYWPSTDVYQLPANVALDGVRGIAHALAGIPRPNAARCQVIAACRDDERAREAPDAGGRPHGVLTAALLAQLEKIAKADLEALRWGRIWRAVEAAVRKQNPFQNPWISGDFGRYVFGFGSDEEIDPGFRVTARTGGYELDVGRLHGVTPGALVAVYGGTPLRFPPAVGSPDERDARKGTLRVVTSDDATSTAVTDKAFALPATPRGRIVTAGPEASLRVRVAPKDPAIEHRVRSSPLVELVDERPDVELLHRSDGAWVLADDVHGPNDQAAEPELAVIPSDRLDAVPAVLEHYVAYSAPLRLARMCRDLPLALQIWVLDCNGRTVGTEEAQNPDLPLVEGGQRAPFEVSPGDRVCFVVENTSDLDLWVTLFDCAASGRVQILGEKRMPGRSRHVFWHGETPGEPFVAEIPKDRTIGADRIVAVGTTGASTSLRHMQRRTAFSEVISPQRTRGVELSTAPSPDMWTAVATTIRIAMQPYNPTDLWIRMSTSTAAGPDEFDCVTVLPQGTPLTTRHKLVLPPERIEALVEWASGDQEWVKQSVESVDLARSIGGQLFRALFDGLLGPAFAAQRSESRELRLRLVTENDALASIPWEFLYDTEHRDYLCLSATTSVVRSIENASPSSLPYPPLPRPLRVLIGCFRIEDAVISEITAPLREAGAQVVELSVMPGMTSDQLATAISGGKADVLHYLGSTPRSQLQLMKPDGSVHVLRDDELLAMLAPAERRPRVVILDGYGTDALARRVAERVEVVIGVRGDVTARASSRFSRKFYSSLLRGASVNRAVMDARRALDLHMPGQREWGLLTLYHRAGDLAFEPAPRALATTARRTPVATTPTQLDLDMARRNLEAIQRRIGDTTNPPAVLARQRKQLQDEIAALVAKLAAEGP